MENLKGLVIDETRNMLIVMTPVERQVKIPKSIITLKIENRGNEHMVIEGFKLLGTPAERIKG